VKDKKGIMVAITAAVSAYLEEEARDRQAAALPRRRPTPPMSMWRFSGRDEIMRMRTLWQRRIV